MALIRSISNPEGLYAWEGNKGRKYFMNISWVAEKPLSSGCGEKDVMIIPSRVFHKAVRRWNSCSYDNVKIRVEGFSIEERHVFPKTGLVVPKSHNLLKDRRKTEFLIRLSYKGKFIHLWRVTWQYLVQNTLSR